MGLNVSSHVNAPRIDCAQMPQQRDAQLETMQFMLQPAADTVSPTMTLHVGTDTVAVRYGQRLYDMIVWL
jgi:hypothetical protein